MAEDDALISTFSQTPKQHRANIARRLSGRNMMKTSDLSLQFNTSQTTYPIPMRSKSKTSLDYLPDPIPDKHHYSNQVISKVSKWLEQEKTRRNAEKASTANAVNVDGTDQSKKLRIGHQRSTSELSEGSLALEKLGQILAESKTVDHDNSTTPTREREGSYFPRRRPSHRRLRQKSTLYSSDTEHYDGDPIVPTAEVVLDNSRTLGYSGGAAELATNTYDHSKRAVKEKEAWLLFKNEIVRLAHTLRLKGWRRVPLDRGGDIEVERLSGALTNAVYVVSPPTGLPETSSNNQSNNPSFVSMKPPPKLLLRIYGPQVAHLIDRESELAILRRLARKKIGPCLLGTFTNGRFEQFFNARTLTATDIRNPETSKQIAKRMRELHDGIELLEEERNSGPFVWRNWDKWVDKCEEVIMRVDRQILTRKQGGGLVRSEDWMKRGLVCGVEWNFFRRAVEKYRGWLIGQCGGTERIRQELVFAHNDTQYGNLLRLTPSGESPLLLPANEHKQLIVIDFEYASANIPGLEFANHFTEWCYNYHDSKIPYALHSTSYPTPAEQYRFLKSYVQHHPNHPSTIPATPGPSNSISSFMLDSRAPPAQIAEEESRREEATEMEIERLMHEARLWRMANSAQWVAWGIVQAKVPETAAEAEDSEDGRGEGALGSHGLTDEKIGTVHEGLDKRPEEGEEDDDEFDYLGYAQERAMLFWGDAVRYGIVGREELPEELRARIKIVEY